MGSTLTSKERKRKRERRNAEDTVADLTGIRTLLGEVLVSVETVSNSSNKAAAVFALDFFNNALQFFYNLSSLDLGEVSAGFNASVRASAEKIISDSKAGVTLPSGEFKLVYHTIRQSVKIIRKVLQLRIDYLLCSLSDPATGATTPTTTATKTLTTTATTTATTTPTTTPTTTVTTLLQQISMKVEHQHQVLHLFIVFFYILSYFHGVWDKDFRV